MPAQLYCSKCRKTMSEVNFYKLKSGDHSEMCKTCETMHINNYDPETFKWLLERYDVPYIPAEWNVLRDRAYAKDPQKMNPMSVFGKYLSKMKLKQWKGFTYADSERLAAEAEEKAKLYGTPEDRMKQKIEEIETAYQNGEITEAQYLTYKEINSPKMAAGPAVVPVGPAFPGQNIYQQASPTDPDMNLYPMNDNPFEKVQLPDVSKDLEDDDKIYLAMKWGRLYTAADWVWLEKKYEDFMASFDIQGAARIDTLIMICKTSLKMNQALDSGDVENYQKLSRVYDAMMKAAKFTEAQRKEEKSGDFDSVGQIVYFAEKEKGKIERYKISQPLDIIDKAIENLKRYTRELIQNDTALAQEIENFMKRKENAEAHKKDIEEAEAAGLEYVQIKDIDYEAFNKLIEEEDENES